MCPKDVVVSLKDVLGLMMRGKWKKKTPNQKNW
jgi:hypothetical protein